MAVRRRMEGNEGRIFVVVEQVEQMWCLDWCLRKRENPGGASSSARKIVASAYFLGTRICVKMIENSLCRVEHATSRLFVRGVVGGILMTSCRFKVAIEMGLLARMAPVLRPPRFESCCKQPDVRVPTFATESYPTSQPTHQSRPIL